jgi:hypothetical protein
MQNWISDFISGTTWGYPVVSAIHVLAFVLFGAVVLIPSVHDDTRWLRRIGISVVVITGVLLFVAGASGYWKSASFKIKLVLLVLIALQAAFRKGRSTLQSAIAFALWAAVIFASRGIAFY